MVRLTAVETNSLAPSRTSLQLGTDDEANHGAQFVEGAQTWFDSVWITIARERESE